MGGGNRKKWQPKEFAPIPIAPLCRKVKHATREAAESQLTNIGWDDLLAERAIVIVEWPDRAPALMPHGHVPISLSHVPGQPDHRILYAGGHT